MSRIYKRNDINIDTDSKVFIKHKNLPNNIVLNDSLEDADNFDVINDNIMKSAQDRADKILFTAHSKATEIENSAQRIAEIIVNEANEKQAELFEEARRLGQEEGYTQGYDTGYNEANEKLELLILEKQNELEEIESIREQLLANTEKDIIDLIISIVEQISYGAIKQNPELYSVLVKRGIANATIQNKVSIKVSNADYDKVMEHYNEIVKSVESTKEIEILKDFSLVEANCLIETEFGNINCGLDEQLKSIKDSLYFILNEK